jgi:putative inorganic carbon (hco3(-)) transporter
MTSRQPALTAHVPEGAGPFPAGTEPTAFVTTPPGEEDGRRYDATVEARVAVQVEQLAAGALVAGAFALPLVIYLGAADAFALPKTALMAAVTTVLAACLAFLRWKHAPAACARSPWTVDVLLIYLALSAAATIRSPDPLHSVLGEPLQLQGMLASVCYALALLAAGRVLATVRRIRWLITGVAAGSVIVVAYGFAQQAHVDPIWDVLNRGRIFSTLGQANNLAAYLVLALPLVLGLALATVSRPARIALVVLVGGIVGALGLTLSRGGYLGALFAVSTFALLALPRLAVDRRRLAGALVAVVAIVATLGAIPPVATSASRIVDRARQLTDVDAGSGALHLDLWAVGIRMTVDHPLLGVGPEIYPAAFPQYRDAVLPAERAAIIARFRPESPHSVPIAIAAGAGVPALAAYVTLIGLALAAGLRRWRRAEPTERILVAGLIAAVIGHFVTDFFMTAEVSTSFLFWVLLGVLATVPLSSSAAPPE